MSDIACPVCFEDIIAPYGIGCGHTICCKCFFSIEETCPICREPFNRNTFSPNTLLESLLRERIPDYDEKRKAYDKSIKLSRCLKEYRKSTRYNDIKISLMEHLETTYMSLDDLREQFKATVFDELCHAINITSGLTALDIFGTTYIVNCSTIRSLKDFVIEHGAFLKRNPLLYIHLFSIDEEDEEDSEQMELAKSAGFDRSIYAKRMLPETPGFTDWITSLTGLTEYVDDIFI